MVIEALETTKNLGMIFPFENLRELCNLQVLSFTFLFYNSVNPKEAPDMYPEPNEYRQKFCLCRYRRIDGLKGLSQVFFDIINVLNSYGKSQHSRTNPCRYLLLSRQLLVSSGRWVDDK